jgi:membrane protein
MPRLAGLAILRWPAMLIVATLVFSVLYRFAPCRAEPRWRWITPGGAIAALAWVAMSALFSWYVQNFGHYDKTYGSLGAMVGFLTWVWLSLMVVLLGAELNREVEKAAEAAARARVGARAGPRARSTAGARAQ